MMEAFGVVCLSVCLSVHKYALMELQTSNFRTGLPRSGKNIWKMNFFPGQGKVRELCGWPGKFRKDLESQGKVREFESKRLWQADIRKFIFLFFSRGEKIYFLMR